MSTTTMLRHFRLQAPPFSKEIEDEALWLSPSKEAVVEGLCEVISDRGSALVVGEPGVGKTCVLRALRPRLGAVNYRLTYCHNATLGKRDFYRQICQALGLSPKATAASVFYTLTRHIEELGRESIHPVLVLDEAHLMQPQMLDHLHILLNYNWDSQALLSVLLVGLPELEDQLRLRRHRSLYSRLARRFRLEPLSPDDSGQYLRMRLKRAGCERELFSFDAVGLLHEATDGLLRDLDRLAAVALRRAAALGLDRVEREAVLYVLAHEG